ncbi:iron-containing redox enzyme family protein [Photobacterium halotolerans]|nr:iron-containing redox enzyme family protein [Photobacterium halotolerans]
MAIESFLSCSHFKDAPKDVFMESPYQRPCRPQDLKALDLSEPVSLENYSSNENLFIQRSILNAYELDLVFLPFSKAVNLKEFKTFYCDENYQNAAALLPSFEHLAFSSLEKSINVSGHWTLQDFIQYTKTKIKDVANSESTLYKKITGSKDPESAARFFFIQCAGDFLSEASAMARNVLGNYGSATSELFKVLIDEYGYGVHEKKHSSIFEGMMKDVGLNEMIHYYWNFYTPGSLSLINYFHYISKNHSRFFKYLGALYYTEATLAFTTKSQSKIVKDVFQGRVSSLYFDEHSHIDIHHGRMALEKIIIPLVELHGEHIIPDILSGFEEFASLQDVADQELYRHIEVHDSLDELIAKAKKYHDVSGAVKFEEVLGEVSVSHIHNNDELFMVDEGELDLYFSPDKVVHMKAGDKIIIPSGILHLSKITSDTCRYSVKHIEVA